MAQHRFAQTCSDPPAEKIEIIAKESERPETCTVTERGGRQPAQSIAKDIINIIGFSRPVRGLRGGWGQDAASASNQRLPYLPVPNPTPTAVAYFCTLKIFTYHRSIKLYYT
jgi:hypothetical protein